MGGIKRIGLIAVYFNDFETLIGYITNVSVLKEYQGSGIATNLLGKVIKFGNGSIFRYLKLKINPTNLKTLKLYERQGFVVTEKDANHIEMRYKLRCSE